MRICTARLAIFCSRTVLAAGLCMPVLLQADQATSQVHQHIGSVLISAGDYDRTDTPLAVNVPKTVKIPSAALWIRMAGPGDHDPVPAQYTADDRSLSWILPVPLKRNGIMTCQIIAMDKSSPRGIEVRDDQKALLLQTFAGKALQFNYAIVEPPAGSDPRYRRGGFIHPLYSPAGRVLTDIHPPDHIHHLGLWHPWTNTRYDGQPVDFWNIGKGQGTVRFDRFLSQFSGPVCGGFRAAMQSVMRPGQNGETIVLNEIFGLWTWAIPSSLKVFVTDYRIAQECATAKPLELPRYRYGGLCLRGARSWLGENRYYLSSEGKTVVDTDGSRARWCMAGGTFPDGVQAGVLILSHPENFDHPEPLRTWGKGFGTPAVFLNFAPTKLTSWSLQPDTTYTRQYRIITFDGRLPAERAERFWQDFAHPPQVRVSWALPSK